MKFLKNVGANMSHAGMAVGGGALARLATNKVAPMVPVLKTYKKFHPVLPFLLGVAMMDYKQAYSVGTGMAAVAGTDLVSEFVPMLQHTAETPVKGIEALPDQLADELERRMNEDVNAAAAALNADVDRAGANMNGHEDINDYAAPAYGIEGQDD